MSNLPVSCSQTGQKLTKFLKLRKFHSGEPNYFSFRIDEFFKQKYLSIEIYE
jgi:hypothetical protein